MEQQGVIQPSNSPWNSPVVLVKKKNGDIRFCVDYRALNEVTKRDTYPLPRIDDSIDSLSGASIFSSLDLKSGYFQCPLAESDREKTAFVTPDGLFEFKVLPFGLSNGPATFERLMDTVLRGRKWKQCLVYLDDLCIFGKSIHEHNIRLAEILHCLDQANLSLNIEKCSFGTSKVIILGHEVSAAGIQPDPTKTEAIRSFPAPKDQKAVRSFLGLCSYYRKFMKNFSKTAAPLNELLKDNVKFKWNNEHALAFETLKEKLINPPLLGHFNPELPITIRTDACKHGIGAILAQQPVGGREYVIAYASRTLSGPESRYSTTDQEGLAVVWAVKKFRPYAYGRKITIVSDHHALCWLMLRRNLTGRLARWALQLQEYDLTVVYKQGRKHNDADCLSRYPISPDTPPDQTTGREDHTTEPPTDPTARQTDTARPITTPAINSLSLQSIGEMQRADPSLDKLRELTKSSAAYEIHHDALFKRSFNRTGEQLLLVLPKPLREETLQAMHCDKEAGHLGIAKTYGRITQKYHWPSIYRETESYVKKCATCQQRKSPTRKIGHLQPMPTPPSVFHTIGIDLLSFNRTSLGNRVIVTAICHLSKFLIAKALPDGTAEQVAKFLLEDVILRYSAPRILLSDQGQVFMSDTLNQLNKICGTEKRRTSAFHPQTNGLCERTHRTLADSLSKYVNKKKPIGTNYCPSSSRRIIRPHRNPLNSHPSF